MSSHTNTHCSPEYHASLRSRFCPECATPSTFDPPSHTVQSTTVNSSSSSSIASILPSSGPTPTSHPLISTIHGSTARPPLDPALFANHKATSLLVESVRQGIPANQLVQLPVGLPVVKPQKGRRRGLHVSSVANALVNAANSNNSLPTAERTTVQPSQNAPQQQVRTKTRKTKLPPPMLLQLVYGQRDEPHTAPDKCIVVGPEILEISDDILDREINEGPYSWKSFLWQEVVLKSGLLDRLKDRSGDSNLNICWPSAVYFVASWGSKRGSLVSLPSSALDAGTLRNILYHPRWFRKEDLRTLVIEVDRTEPTTTGSTTYVSWDAAEEEAEEARNMTLPENWDPSRVQMFYNEDGADPDAPRITTHYDPPTPEPEFLSEGLLATLAANNSSTDRTAIATPSVAQASPVATASATTTTPTTPPPASGTATKVCYSFLLSKL